MRSRGPNIISWALGGVAGAFAGYSLKDGYRWGGHYLAQELRGSARADLRADSHYGAFAPLTTHRVQRVELPGGG
eukprot:7571921-Alexandrium_andersonii.AAC.1